MKKNTINLFIKTKKVEKLDFDVEKLALKILNKFVEIEKLKKIYSVDITITTNQNIHKINKETRNIDSPTDVLSFPMMCEDYDLGTVFLGDVIISIDKVILQSKNYGHSMKREFSFLLCHSLLHLIGYDHENEKDEMKMFKKQNLILDELNIKR